MSNSNPTCSVCGYTEEDAKFHMDHHLCKNSGNAPWEKKADAPSTNPREQEKMTDRSREVDPDGKCGKCGGLHYGTGWHCVYPTCTHCSRPITCVGQRCSNDALCMPIEENKR